MLACALGGKVEKMNSLPSNRSLMCGKEEIHMEASFFKLPFVKSLLEKTEAQSLKEELKTVVLFTIHGDHIT